MNWPPTPEAWAEIDTWLESLPDMPGVVCPICGYGRLGDVVDPPCLDEAITEDGQQNYAKVGCLFFTEIDE